MVTETPKPKTITFSVTQGDIDKGKRGSPYYCPIAQSYMRRFRTALASALTKDIRIWGHHLGLDRKPQWYSLPRKATAFTHAFDRGKPVKPFRFTVDIDG